MPRVTRIIQNHVDWILVFCCSYILFSCILANIATDIQIHALSVLDVNRNVSPYPPNFLYYLLVNLVSGFSVNEVTLIKTSGIVLSLAVTAKYLITKHIILSAVDHAGNKKGLIIFVAVCSLVLFAIPDVYNLFYLKQIYISRIVPNVWHNSTIITLAPFAILLCWKQYIVLSSKESPGIKTIFLLFVLMLINVLIKPSFFFVYAPVTTVFLFFRYRFKLPFFVNLAPILITAIVVYLLQQMIYVQHIASLYDEKSSVAFTTPFYVWMQMIPAWYIPIALIMSFILPLTWFICYGKPMLVDRKLFQYVLWMMATGILISAVVSEKGPRELHLNFFWQNVICCYLLNLVVNIDVLKRYSGMGKMDMRMKIYSLVFLAHVLAGIFYFVVMFYRQHYR
jgi:hypothetical protein